ncbi:MAG: hypothetical protein V8S87_05360 [Oscillospiraceae bacterium]
MTASAMEITCGRYIQEPGACRFLAGELKLISAKKAYIMGGRRALEAALARMEESSRRAVSIITSPSLKATALTAMRGRMPTRLLPGAMLSSA